VGNTGRGGLKQQRKKKKNYTNGWSESAFSFSDGREGKENSGSARQLLQQQQQLWLRCLFLADGGI